MTNVSSDTDYVRSLVGELAAGCPWRQTNPADCPLHTIRCLSAAKRRKWLAQASQQLLDEIYVYHWVCLEEKVLGDPKRQVPRPDPQPPSLLDTAGAP